MTGPQLATLSTIAWVAFTLAFLIVFGTWSSGGSWSILPGLVRGVHDWAAEQAAARTPSSPSPWAVPSTPATSGHGGSRSDAGVPDEPEELPLAAIEELGERPLR
jgi:hypothetical protein